MKKKSFRYGKSTYTSLVKNVGHGYEVILKHGSKVLFTGNFINSKEANSWYSHLNKELKVFFKKYWATEDTSIIFYNKLLKNFTYNNYYKFLTRHVVPKQHKLWEKQFNKNLKEYKNLKKYWYSDEKLKIKNVA